MRVGFNMNKQRTPEEEAYINIIYAALKINQLGYEWRVLIKEIEAKENCK